MTDHTPPTDTQLDDIAARAASLHEYATLDDAPFQADADQLTGTDVPALLAEVRRQRTELAELRGELERPAVELKRNEIRLSYRQLAVQAREDRDYEGEATVLKQLADHEEQWKREDAAVSSPSVPSGVDRAELRDRIRRAICEAEGFAWDSDMLEPDEYGDHADLVLAALPAPGVRGAVLLEAAAEIAGIDAHPNAMISAADAYAGIATRLRRMADEAQQSCDGCGHSGHPARECMVTSYGERCACDEPVTGEAQQPEAQAIDDYLRFLRGQGPEPDLSKLPPQQREAVAGQFEIVRALADRDGELPPIDRDPVARRLGLHGPADETQQQADTETRPHCPHCQLPHDLEPGSLPVAACESIRARIAEAGHRHAEDDHGGCAAVDCEVALLRLTLDAVEEGRRELRSDDARLRSQLWTLTAIFEGFARLLATSSRDWGQYAPDAWLYAVICGWDCEEPVHDETCTHGAMEEMQQRHGWDDETVAKARRYRAAVRAVVESGKEA